MDYWWVVAAGLVLATVLGLGIWLITKSKNSEEAEEIEPGLLLSGRSVKKPRSNIFKYKQSERITLDPVENEPVNYNTLACIPK